MKSATTFISRVALIAGVLVAVTAQPASAGSVASDSQRGRSCWAHSRHTAHKHAVGHDHDRCHPDDHHGDHDDDHDGSPSTSTTVPAAPGDAASPDSGSSESTPSDRVATPVAEVPALSPISTTTVPGAPTEGSPIDLGNDIVGYPPKEVPTGDNPTDNPTDTLPADDNAGVDVPALGIGKIGAPAESADLTSVGSTDVQGEPGADSLIGLWWVLLVLVAGAEAYRRWRRAVARRATDTPA